MIRNFREMVREAEQHELREPTAATKAINYSAPGMAMTERWNAASSVEYAYLANVFVFACVRAITNALIAGKFHTGLDPEKPQRTNPASKLAHFLGPPPGSPNPAWSSRRMWSALAAQYIVTGKLGMENETADGTANTEVTRLWPLVSQWLDAIPSTGGDSYWDGFKYGRRGKQVKLRPDQVTYIWNPSADDFRQPMSALQAARLDIDVAIMQDRYMRAFLRNDARPAGIIVTEAFDVDEERQAFRRQWQERYGGPDQAGRMAFIEASGGDKPPAASLAYVQLGLSQKDQEFLPIYERKLLNICIGLGVPMSMLDASGRTFNNSSLEVRNFYEDTVIPLAIDLGDQINTSLAPRLGRELGWWDFSHLASLRPPQRFQNVDPVALKRGGIIAPEQIAEDLGFDPQSGLQDSQDLLFRSQAAQALGMAGADLMTALTIAGLPTAGAVEKAKPPPAPTPIVPLLPPGRSQRDVDSDNSERRATSVRLTEQHRSALEPSWRRAFLTLFDRQAQETAKRMTAKRGWQLLRELRADTPGDITDEQAGQIFDPAFWEQQTSNLAQPLLDSVFAVAAGRVSSELGYAFDVSAPYVIDYIQQRANQLAGEVTDTTYQAVKDAMSEGVRLGEGADAIARRLRTIVGLLPQQIGQVNDAIAAGQTDDQLATLRTSLTTDRATTIARTEVVSGYNGSTYTMGQNLPSDVLAEYEWLAIHDQRTRETHAAADGQRRAKGTPFDVGGSQMLYPGDPMGPADEVVNCRCALGLIPASRGAGNYLERRAAADWLGRLGRREVGLEEMLRTLEVAA